MTNCHPPCSRAPSRSPTPCSAGTWRLKQANARPAGARPTHSHLLKRRGGRYSKRFFWRRSGGLTPGTLRKRMVKWVLEA
eukprot:5169145-Alexandrium_andersonii.AAC.1